MDPVAVIGGSNGGYAAAADYSAAGHDVQWYVRTPTNHEAVLETEQVTLRVSEHYPGDRRIPGDRSAVDVGTVTTDLATAVSGAAVVVVPLPTTAQRALIDDLVPHLADGQVVAFCPGNFGSFLLHRALVRREDAATAHRVVTGETPTMPYVTRRSGPAEVTINLDAVRLPVGAFPGQESARATEAMGQLYEAAVPATDALDCALLNSNPCVNAVPTVLNAGAIENDELDRFNIHRHGIGPGVYNVLMAVDAERIRLRAARGYGEPHIRQDEYYRPDRATTGEHFYGRGARDALSAAETFSEDPPSLDDRYVHEDIGIASVLWQTLAGYLDVDTPTLDAVVHLAETLMDEPYRRTGRSMDRLGLSELAPAAFDRLLAEGSG